MLNSFRIFGELLFFDLWIPDSGFLLLGLPLCGTDFVCQGTTVALFAPHWLDDATQRKTHQITQIRHFRAAETTIHNNWGRFTFISTFPRYNFTIVRLFNLFPYISLCFEQTTRLAPCVGPLCGNPVVRTMQNALHGQDLIASSLIHFT